MKKLNFGCGNDIIEGFDNVDLVDFDFNKFPYPVKDNTYDYIVLNQVLEHLTFADKVLLELHRIAKPNAIIRIEVPYYNNKGAFNDIEHIHYFTEKTFFYFVKKYKNFQIKSLRLTPTMIGKFMPSTLCEKLSVLIGGLVAMVHVELKVKKTQ